MARRRVTVELDGDLLDAAKAAAARLGIPEDELFERTLREVLARDFDRLTDEIAAFQTARGIVLSDEEAMALANEEVRALRAERGDAS
jgi:hypothetical protein